MIFSIFLKHFESFEMEFGDFVNSFSYDGTGIVRMGAEECQFSLKTYRHFMSSSASHLFIHAFTPNGRILIVLDNMSTSRAEYLFPIPQDKIVGNMKAFYKRYLVRTEAEPITTEESFQADLALLKLSAS